MRALRSIALALVATVLISCGATDGGLLRVPFRAGGMDQPSAQPITLTSTLGWSVTLTKAKIALGPFYFKQQGAEGKAPTDLESITQTNMQVTRQVVIDVLDPDLKLVADGGDGRMGDSKTVSIGLLAPDDTASDEDARLLKQHFGYIEGSATKDGVTVPFGGFMTIDKSLVTAQQPLELLQQVPWAAVDLSFTSNQQELVLRVDPTHWFDQADFGALTTSTPSNGLYTWEVKSTFHAQLLQGVKTESGVYDFSLRTLAHGEAQ